MAIEKVINITVNQRGTDKALAQTDKLNQKFKQLQANTYEVTKGLHGNGNAILENGWAMGLLNDVTGGYAMTVKDAVEATGLFSKVTTITTTAQKLYTLVVGTTTGALKALRVALVSTGLGAIVVLLGLFIAKMNESTDATEHLKTMQDAYNATLERTNQLYKDSITSLQDFSKEQVLRAKIAGKSASEIAKIEKQAEDERYKNYVNERTRLENLLKNRSLTAEQQKIINAQLSANQKEYFKSVSDGRVKDLEEELTTVEAKRQAQKDLLAKQAEDRAKAREEEARKQKEYEESLLKGLNEFQIAKNEAEFRQKEIDAQNQIDKDAELQQNVDRLQKEIEADQIASDKKIAIEKAKEETLHNLRVSTRQNTENLLLMITKKGSALAKGIAIADIVRQQVKAVSTSISALTEANAKAVAASPLTAGQPFVALNTASTLTGIALSVTGAGKAIKDILSDSKSASAGNVSGGGGAAAPAPSFNLVQGTGSNQIAQGLATERNPVKAYVVASEVSTGQSLNRNIIDNASL